ncbi:MAG TPA: glycosyltransferase [Gemmatimonadales bacterium]|nr:glycosyltransferase [Gemmatimonadales bacterium]
MGFARVFALVPDCHTSGRYARLWRRHFYEGLEGVIPTVVLPREVDYDWARPPQHVPPAGSPARDRVSDQLWQQVKGAHERGGLSAVLSYCFVSDIDPAVIARTVEMGVPWINFFCDSVYAFDYVEALARVTSLNWFPEHAALPNYRAAGRPLLCRPYALNPAALPAAFCETADHAVGFVGAPTSNRVILLAALWALGCRVAVRGEGWIASRSRPAPKGTVRTRGSRLERLVIRFLKPIVQRGSTPLSASEMTAFLAHCRLVLGLNEGRDIDGKYRSYLKFRDIEFPGYGCCYLTQHNADVVTALEPGREVLTFHHVSEAASLIRWSKRHPREAQAIGHAARTRVFAEHTWATRITELARAL